MFWNQHSWFPKLDYAKCCREITINRYHIINWTYCAYINILCLHLNVWWLEFNTIEHKDTGFDLYTWSYIPYFIWYHHMLLWKPDTMYYHINGFPHHCFEASQGRGPDKAVHITSHAVFILWNNLDNERSGSWIIKNTTHVRGHRPNSCNSATSVPH